MPINSLKKLTITNNICWIHAPNTSDRKSIFIIISLFYLFYFLNKFTSIIALFCELTLCMRYTNLSIYTLSLQLNDISFHMMSWIANFDNTKNKKCHVTGENLSLLMQCLIHFNVFNEIICRNISKLILRPKQF